MNGIVERAVRRTEEGTSAALLRNQDWMKNGGLIPGNATAICETSKPSWQTGKHLLKGDLENHLMAQ